MEWPAPSPRVQGGRVGIKGPGGCGLLRRHQRAPIARLWLQGPGPAGPKWKARAGALQGRRDLAKRPPGRKLGPQAPPDRRVPAAVLCGMSECICEVVPVRGMCVASVHLIYDLFIRRGIGGLKKIERTVITQLYSFVIKVSVYFFGLSACD